MGALKGQNFRVCLYDSTAQKYKVVGLSTNCTITLTGNTENASTKDNYDLASMPQVVSKSWQVQVDSLNVGDLYDILNALKTFRKFTLMWDETETSNNQNRAKAAWALKGEAYLSDVSFNFNDRENSTKQLTFTGTGPLSAVEAAEAVEVIPIGTYTKGQFIRLMLASDSSGQANNVIAAAKQLSLHASLTIEQNSTKDTEGDWLLQEPTELNYDITTNALVRSGDTITSQVVGLGLSDLQTIWKASTPVYWSIGNASGANNRTVSPFIHGQVIIASLVSNAPNRQDASYTATLNGYGSFDLTH